VAALGYPDPTAFASHERSTLTLDEDPNIAPDPPSEDRSGPVRGGDGAEGEPGTGTPPPGVFDSIGGTRAAIMRMIAAHFGLLKAELMLAGKEVGIIVALGVVALTIAILTLILVYVGSFLFFGEWLFGSMAWGIIHGTLLSAAGITAIALNLAGGWMGAYGRGFAIGFAVTVVLSLFFASNLLRESAVAVANGVEDSVPLHAPLLPTLVGLVVGAGIGALLGFFAGRNTEFRARLALAGSAIGAIFGSILASAVFDNPGAVAISLTIGLLAWVLAAVALAANRGFDPETRYANLVPRQSMAAFEGTREFATEQFERQKRRFSGR
jgi:hypothetical protein